MPTLSFTGTSSQFVGFTTLSGGLDVFAAGIRSVFILGRRPTSSGFQQFWAMANNARTTAYGSLGFNASTVIDDYDTGTATGPTWGTTTDWGAFGYTLDTADTPDIIFKLRNHTTDGAWASTNGSLSPGFRAGLPASNGFFQFGRWLTSDYLTGQVAVAAFWTRKLSAGEWDEIVANDRTSDIWNVSGGQPAALIEFNVAHASLVDLAGHMVLDTPVSSPTLTGPDPDRWTFDGTGTTAVEPTQWRSPFSPAMRVIGRSPRGLVEVRYAPETVGGQLLTLDLIATGTDAALFGPTQVGIVRAATGASVSQLVRQARIVRVAASTAIGLVTRASSRTLNAPNSATALVAKITGKTVQATNTATGTVLAVKTKLLTLVGTNGAVALIVKRAAKTLAGTSGAAASTTKQASKTFAAASPNVGIVAAIKTKLLTLATSNAAAGFLVKQVRAVRTGAGSSSATLATIATFRRTITAGGTNAASIVKQTMRTLSAAQAAAAAFQGIRTKLLTVSAASSAAATVRRSVSAVRVAASPQAATIRKAVSRTLSASSPASAVVTAGRLVIRVLTAAGSSAASVASVLQQAVLGFIDSLGGVLFSTDSDSGSSGVEGRGAGTTTDGASGGSTTEGG